ncbi:MAG: hypothetical protein GC139_10450 [Sideroxydans sp.]|nr:hypothetical protein [Sideroxydans sp.]
MTARLIAFLLSVALGAGATWMFAHNHYSAVIADLNAQHANEQAAADRAALKRLQDAQARGDALSKKLSRTEAALEKKKHEVTNEIALLTSGRACLDGRLVRVLNEFGTGVAGLSKASGSTDAAGGTTATDTDVAGWISIAKTRYETCRTRLDRLIDFNEGTGDGREQ